MAGQGPSGARSLPAETLAEAAKRLAKAFKDAGLDTPDLDARILVCEAAGLPRSVFLATPERRLSPDETALIARFMQRRLGREPVSRILGRREFRGLTFELGPTTLDPRPDTETLVEVVLELSRRGEIPSGPAARILDLGTGSGAILIALLAALPGASGVGVDLDPAALEVAAANAGRAGVAGRATFCHSDWYDGVEGLFDVVVSNPPYIATPDIAALEPEVARFDPILALDGGSDGFAAYRRITAGIGRVLRPGGWLALEAGIGQALEILHLCRAAGLQPAPGFPCVWQDLGGVDRCVAVKAR
jgi:release factor glutamine methyltransferase